MPLCFVTTALTDPSSYVSTTLVLHYITDTVK